MLSLDSGTVDTSYGLDNMLNTNPAIPTKFTTPDMTLLISGGGPLTIAVIGLLHMNLDRLSGGSTCTVVVQGNDTASWASPSLQARFPLVSIDRDGFVPGVYLNLLELFGSSAITYNFWRVVVSNNAGSNFILGELAAYSTLHRIEYLQPGPTVPRLRMTASLTTSYGVEFKYDRGVKMRLRSGALVTKALSTIEQWFDDTRADAKAFLIVPDIAASEALFMRWNQTALQPKRLAVGAWTIPYAFKEVSRGLAWGAPPFPAPSESASVSASVSPSKSPSASVSPS
jgi:hypothetical protein